MFHQRNHGAPVWSRGLQCNLVNRSDVKVKSEELRDERRIVPVKEYETLEARKTTHLRKLKKFIEEGGQ